MSVYVFVAVWLLSVPLFLINCYKNLLEIMPKFGYHEHSHAKTLPFTIVRVKSCALATKFPTFAWLVNGMRRKYTFKEPGKATKKTKAKDGNNQAGGKKEKRLSPPTVLPYLWLYIPCEEDPTSTNKVHSLKANSKEYNDLLTRVQDPVRESHMRPYYKRP